MTRTPDDTSRANKRLFWTAAAFYALIAFEFFYMASGHSVPRDADPDRWKVVVTRAAFGAGQDGSQILRQAINKSPLIELHIALSAMRIAQRLPPPQEAFYDGMQVPVF